MSPIALNPTQVLSRTALAVAGGEINDAGSTTGPAGYTVPDFNIVCQQGKLGWTSRVQLLARASEGNNLSLYLGPGLYPTGLMMQGGYRITYTAGGGVRIYAEIDSTIAGLSRLAELEHCNDFRQAYAISLKAAETAIAGARDGSPYGPFSKRDQAMGAARNALTHGIHTRLAKVFRDAVQVGWNVNRHKFKSDLGNLYDTLCQMSQPGRDGLGFHTFEPDRTSSSWSPWSWTEYLGEKTLKETWRSGIFGEKKDIRRLVRGPYFNVPGPTSATVIHL